MIAECRTVVVTSKEGRQIGFVAIDSTVNGRARGGLRLLPDVSESELRKLARAMTLKYGFLGLPQGGAKGGVLGDPETGAEARASCLRGFAAAARDLLVERMYVPDADMGTSGPEIQQMLHTIGIRPAAREYRGSRSGDYTAATTFQSARAAAEAANLELAGCRVAIEGFGKVGGALAEMFAGAGARLVAVSTASTARYNPRGLDVAALRAVARRSPEGLNDETIEGDRIEHADVKRVPAEIFCPCARHDSVRAGDASRMPAKIISCGANSPITPEAERELLERGVICIPDFIANCGGVLGGTMEFAGWDAAKIFDFCALRFRPRVGGLIRDSLRAGRSLREAGEEFSLERFRAVKQAAESPSLKGRAMAAALAAFREGLVPASLVRRLSVPYFESRL